MKTTEMRDMTSAELSLKLDDLKKELFALRFQLAANQLGQQLGLFGLLAAQLLQRSALVGAHHQPGRQTRSQQHQQRHYQQKLPGPRAWQGAVRLGTGRQRGGQAVAHHAVMRSVPTSGGLRKSGYKQTWRNLHQMNACAMLRGSAGFGYREKAVRNKPGL